MMRDILVLTFIFRLGWLIWPEQDSTLLSPRSKRVISYQSGESGHKQLSSNTITLSCKDTCMWPYAVLIYRRHCIGRPRPAPPLIVYRELEASLYSNTESMYPLNASPPTPSFVSHLFFESSTDVKLQFSLFFDCCCAEDVLKLRQCSVSVMS
jgi:hypothetical protein